MARPSPPLGPNHLGPDHLGERELAGEVVGDATGRVLASEGLPVIARLVVEIRSDGTRTIARGAMEDPEGQRVVVEVQGTTPWALAKQLAGALWRMPRLPRPSLRALLPGRRRTRGEG